MAKYRVRANSLQVYTQFYTVEADNPAEAIEKVKAGEVQLTYERFEEVDDFTPTHAYPAHSNHDFQTQLAPCDAYVVPQATNAPTHNHKRTYELVGA